MLRRATSALRCLSPPNRPFVTLTFAQSLDASLSYAPSPSSPPLLLSSPASLRLTHYLRAVHSAILVGANTLQCDNPSLTCRLVPNARSPTPVILEGGGAEVSAADERKAVRDGTWVVMNERGVRSDRVGRAWTREAWSECGNEGETTKERRVSDLLERGCRVLILPCASAASSHVAFPTLLAHLHPHFHSLMVEGGAGVITSLLRQSEPCCVDQLLLTVAPMFVGGWRSVQGRIGETGVRLYDASCEMCGDDVIVHAFTSPSSLPQLSSMAAASDSTSVIAQLTNALSSLASSLHRTCARMQQQLAPIVSHVFEPYNSLVYSSVALPPLVLLCHTLLRLRAIRRLLPLGVTQRLDRWTAWRASLLLLALLLLAHYLLQQWAASRSTYSWLDDSGRRVVQSRHTRQASEHEMRVFPSASPAATASALPSPSPLSSPAQSYLLPFTSPSNASRPAPPASLPHRFAPSMFGAAYSALPPVPGVSKAGSVLQAIKHNRRQSQAGGGGYSSGGGGRRRQQLSGSGSDAGSTGGAGGEVADATAIEGESKERD